MARSDYDGAYWPHHIEHLPDEGALCFVENLIHLVPLGPQFCGSGDIRKQATPNMNSDTKQTQLHELNTHTHTTAWNQPLWLQKTYKP